MRIATLASVISTLVVGLALADPVQALVKRVTNIPQQRLGSALRELAREHQFQVFFRSDVVDNLTTDGASGQLTTDEAMKKLLAGTRLTYMYLDDHTVTIVPISTKDTVDSAADPHSRTSASGDVTSPDISTTNDNQSSDISFWDRYLVAQAGQSSNASSVIGQSSSSSDDFDRSKSLAEVVVTAQKKSERLIDVPIPMTVISGDSLVSSNQFQFLDFYSSVPGLSFNGGSDPGERNQIIAIRGITTGVGNPTVGFTVDDIPVGSASGYGGEVPPDIDPGDVAQIEVLRGPQGTLYGSSSIGGLIKYVTIDPSPENFSARFQAGTSTVYNGAELGYNFRGAVNVPLNDTMALRASLFTREDPGYIDNRPGYLEYPIPASLVDGLPTQKGFNEGWDSGGRLAYLWRPSESLSLKLSALVQQYHGNGEDYAVYGLPPLTDSAILGTGPYAGSTQAYSATLKAKVAGMEITSLSGYAVDHSYKIDDYSFWGVYSEAIPGWGGATGVGFAKDYRTGRFTQELRLSTALGHFADWLFGVYYTHEYTSGTPEGVVIDPATGLRVATAFTSTEVSTYAEYAAFMDFTLHLTDRLDLQVGGRQGNITQVFQAFGFYDPLFTGGSTVVTYTPRAADSAKPFTYLFSPQFRISPDLMVYARLASGYRVAGVNPCLIANVPCQYNPDKTYDYDLGIKGEFFQRMLTVDMALYTIDWNNIQLNALTPPPVQVGFTTNVAAAKSQGVELSVEVRPVGGLKIGGWVSLSDARITQSFPLAVTSAGIYAVDGSRLPDSPRLSGNLSVDEEFTVANGVTASVGGTETYVGNRVGGFSSDAATPLDIFSAYAKLDLHAALRFGSWTASVFGTNVVNRNGSLSGNPGTESYSPIPPRLVGINITKTFGHQ